MKSWLSRAVRFDRFLASRMPGLHVTRVHWVALSVIPWVAVAGLIQAGTIPLPREPVSAYKVLGILLIVFGCAAPGWLIYRGLAYRLLPVARGLARAHWVWLDLLSVLCIVSPALVLPLALEARYRATHSLKELDADLRKMGLSQEIDVQYRGITNLLYRHTREARSGSPELAVPMPGETHAILSKYGSIESLEMDNQGLVSKAGLESSARNLDEFLRAHIEQLLLRSDVTQFLLFGAGILTGLVLLLNSLPAVEVSGLLCGLAWIVGGIAVMGVAGFMGTYQVLYSIVISFAGCVLLVTAVAVVRRKCRLMFRVSTALCALLFPFLLTSFSVECLSSMGGWKMEDALGPGWAILLSLLLIAPLWQWWVNRLKAYPE